MTNNPFRILSKSIISTSDVYFYTNDQTLSVGSGSKSQITPDISWTPSGSSTTISYSVSDYPGYNVTSWVSIDSVSGQLTINAPISTSDVQYMFYVSSAISAVSCPTLKLILLTVKAWKVANWQTWISDSSSTCSAWVSDYALNTGTWAYSSQLTQQTAEALKYTSIAIVTSISGLVVVSSVMSSSSMASLWLLINQVQIFFLLLLTRAFIPNDIQTVITGSAFSLNPSSYILMSFNLLYLNLFNLFDCFDFGLSNSLLEPFGIKSDSSVYNWSSFVCIMIMCNLFYLILLWLKCCSSTSQANENTSRWNKIVTLLIKKAYEFFTFSYYIRALIEMNQFILVSSINEIHQFNVTGGLRITSLVVAFWLLALCLSLITISLYLAVTFDAENQSKCKHFKEFFAGLKPQKKFRLYTSIQIFRRVLFVLILIIFDTTLAETIVTIIWVLQFIYLVYAVILRPFDEIKTNIIEILNEVYILALFMILIFINTAEKWSSTKIMIYIWVIWSNSIIILLIVWSEAILKIKYPRR